MTDHEFDQWFRAHNAAFPELAGLFDKGGDAKAAVDRWRDLLRSSTLEECDRATLAMERADEKLWNTTDHMRAIRQLVNASRNASRSELENRAEHYDDSEPRHRCVKCHDGGMGYVKSQVRSLSGGKKVIAAMAACDCEAGDAKRNWMPATANNVSYLPDDAEWPRQGGEWEPGEHINQYAG